MLALLNRLRALRTQLATQCFNLLLQLGALLALLRRLLLLPPQLLLEVVALRQKDIALTLQFLAAHLQLLTAHSQRCALRALLTQLALQLFMPRLPQQQPHGLAGQLLFQLSDLLLLLLQLQPLGGQRITAPGGCSQLLHGLKAPVRQPGLHRLPPDLTCSWHHQLHALQGGNPATKTLKRSQGIALAQLQAERQRLWASLLLPSPGVQHLLKPAADPLLLADPAQIGIALAPGLLIQRPVQARIVEGVPTQRGATLLRQHLGTDRHLLAPPQLLLQAEGLV